MSDLATVPPATAPATSAAAPAVSGATNRERYAALTEIRVQDPEAVRRAADARTKRSLTGGDGHRPHALTATRLGGAVAGVGAPHAQGGADTRQQCGGGPGVAGGRGVELVAAEHLAR